jgi:threonine dehydratase
VTGSIVTAPTILDVQAARRRLLGHLSATPLREAASLSETVGRPVLLKLESLNLTHSFKVRGAFNALLRLIEVHGSSSNCPRIVTASAGNHGRAMACAAQALGLHLVVFTPATAPRTKTEAIRRHGAALHDDAPDYDAAEARARAFAEREGASYISPYNHPDIIAGAGTIGLEVIEQCPGVTTVVMPLGGGGLASGVGIALRAVAPATRIIGVEAEASTPFTTGLAQGVITTIHAGVTLADGLAGNLEPGTMTFPLVRRVVDEVLTVGEDRLAAAMRHIAAEEHLIVEGSSAVAIAALESDRLKRGSGPLAVIVSGANIDLPTFVAAVSS